MSSPFSTPKGGALARTFTQGAEPDADGRVINDVTIGVATANGSGSQSANLILLRTLFAMGLPVSAKNLFPSNIAGLPTWYLLRVSPHGDPAPGPAVNIGVVMNERTFDYDLEHLVAGSVAIVNADLKRTVDRDDLIVHMVPFTKLAREIDTRLAKKIANMVYVGVLVELLGLDPTLVEAALRQQFAGKQRAIDLNAQAIDKGRQWFREHETKQDAWTVEARPVNHDLILMEGNQAAALGAVFGGLSVLTWYPITPSSGLADAATTFLEELRTDPESGEHSFAVVQAEDEIAAIGMVLGAGWTGARAMTATSGPGIALMTEFIGYASYAEIPSVIWNVQRVGPSTGLPTRTQQSDVIACHLAGHGDTRHPVLFPGTVAECFEDGWRALDLAERLQTLVFALSDLDLGMNTWVSERPTYPDRPMDRGKIVTAAELAAASHGNGSAFADWGRYRDLDGDAIPWRTLPGNPHPKAALLTRGSGHDEDARYTEDGAAYQRNMARLAAKLNLARTLLPAPVIDEPIVTHPDGMPGEKPADLAIISFGSTVAAIQEARRLYHADGTRTAHCRVRALPFHPDVLDFIARHEHCVVVELNRDGQLHGLLRQEVPDEHLPHLRSAALTDGLPPRAIDIIARIKEVTG